MTTTESERVERFFARLENLRAVMAYPLNDKHGPSSQVYFHIDGSSNKPDVGARVNNMTMVHSLVRKAGCTLNFARAAVHHVYQESRGAADAFNKRGPAYGLFQIKNTGLGKSRKYFLNGKTIADADSAITYNGFDPTTNVQSWLSAANKLKIGKAEGSVAENYYRIFWTPLGAGYPSEEVKKVLEPRFAEYCKGASGG